MKEFVKQLDGYDEVVREIDISRKFGIDYRADRGKTRKVIDRYHPDVIEYTVTDIIEETPDVKTLRLVSKSGYLPPFQAGQYINVYAEVQGIRTSRPYSISSSPRQRAYYEITIGRVENGFFSDFLLGKIRRGDSLKSSGPSGNFYFNPLFHRKNSVFIAGGTGITPFMSMMREICDAGLERRVTLLYGSRTEKNITFNDELLDMASRFGNVTYIPVISEPSQRYSGKKGFIDSNRIMESVPDIVDCTFYICGPGAMYDFCLPQLEALNIPGKRIRKEMFSSSGDITKEAGWPAGMTGKETFNVTIKGGRNIKATSGETLLSSLERAGLVVPVNCRSGECSMCRIKLVSGTVFQPRGVLLREADVRFGYVHSCKAYPLEDLEIIL
ncbi:MAG TPA: FAD-binding oxidoreductase [Spirochaetota bacterium]|nr:FAD-binding oxidoreductase [Spirochaetota bacterium]HPI91310.1 FAD-binding oxidoreductase [Spirochaetota bacterium]HPR49191.1 FAD-binding oxidoreductase [Spirochaetota bacterium]